MCRTGRDLHTGFPASEAASQLGLRGSPQFLPHYYDYYDVLYYEKSGTNRATGVDT
jgi:hypothetical protein